MWQWLFYAWYLWKELQLQMLYWFERRTRMDRSGLFVTYLSQGFLLGWQCGECQWFASMGRVLESRFMRPPNGIMYLFSWIWRSGLSTNCMSIELQWSWYVSARKTLGDTCRSGIQYAIRHGMLWNMWDVCVIQVTGALLVTNKSVHQVLVPWMDMVTKRVVIV